MNEISATGSFAELNSGKSESSISPRSRLWLRARRNPQMLIGLLCVGLFLAMALAAPLLAPQGYAELDLKNRFQAPSKDAILGTDELGRDLFSRILYGGQVSLQVAAISVGVSLLAGIPLGLISAYYGGIIESVIMRFMDALQAFPPVLLAIVIATVLGPGLRNAMIAIGIVSIPSFARIMRGQVLQINNYEYVMAARAIGAPDRRILAHHILPNGIAPLLVATALASATAILTEASLSFVGLGAIPPQPSWGGLLQSGYPYMRQALWLSVYPGLAIAITTLGFNFLGDGVRDVLDPKLHRG